MVKASRVASEGARALTQDAVSTSREGFEKAADAIRTLAEAKSPTEYVQLQGEFARASFDRMVAEGSKMAESMVKLAGEAFQPISNRATANAERFNRSLPDTPSSSFRSMSGGRPQVGRRLFLCPTSAPPLAAVRGLI